MNSTRAFLIVRKFLYTIPSKWNSTYVSDNVQVPFANKYDYKSIEGGKYEKWEKCGYFQSNLNNMNSNRPFTLILPPPNVTGILHLGHALTITIQDVLCRWKRMQNIPVVWVPGIDHAGIATQVAVEKHIYATRKITRFMMGKNEFKAEIMRWKTEKEALIKEQLKQLGASLDWSRYIFTLSDDQTDIVLTAVVNLFDAGLVYQKETLVNWCCSLQSTISDMEVDGVEVDGPTKLQIPGYEEPVEFGTMIDIAFKICDSDETVIVSTTRLETLPGDICVAVHPNDIRYQHLNDTWLYHPLTLCKIPLVFDSLVDPTFGTGAVKITPGHNHNDMTIAQRHGLRILPIFTDDGLLNENCKEFYGLKRFCAKTKFLDILYERNAIKGIRNHKMNLPVCSRTGDVIEYLLKPQWFVKCEKLRKEFVAHLESNNLRLSSAGHKKILTSWLQSDVDWCISRQLWWGHQLPLYKTIRGWVAAKSEGEAKIKAIEKFGFSEKESFLLEQEESVLDTWFSSALLPFSVFGYPEKTDAHFDKLYPLSVVITGYDILCFWVMRMVMMGIHFTGKLPFSDVELHGLVCDAQGKKMSKSLGNVILPDNVINGIALAELGAELKSKYASGLLSLAEYKKTSAAQKSLFPQGIPAMGADALRFTLVSQNYKNQVIHFDVEDCQINYKFCNKIWQASKFVIGWAIKCGVSNDESFIPVSTRQQLSHKWILSRLAHTVQRVENYLNSYDVNGAAVALKEFFHYDFCDVFLEICKPILKNGTELEGKISSCHLLYCLETYLRMLSPFMPFLTEEIYAYLPDKRMEIVSEKEYPSASKYNKWRKEEIDEEMSTIRTIIHAIRGMIASLKPTKDTNQFVIVSDQELIVKKYLDVIECLVRFPVVIRQERPDNLESCYETVEYHTELFMEGVTKDHLVVNLERLEAKKKKLENLVENIRKDKNGTFRLQFYDSKINDYRHLEIEKLEEENRRLGIYLACFCVQNRMEPRST